MCVCVLCVDCINDMFALEAPNLPPSHRKKNRGATDAQSSLKQENGGWLLDNLTFFRTGAKVVLRDKTKKTTFWTELISGRPIVNTKQHVNL